MRFNMTSPPRTWTAVLTAALLSICLVAENSSAQQVLTGHTDDVRSVAYSPDGQTIASGSLDGTIRIWNAATGAHVRTLEENETRVFAVGYSPDGQTIASGNFYNTISVWNAQTGAHLKTLEERVNGASVCRVGDVLQPGDSCYYPGTDIVIRVEDGSLIIGGNSYDVADTVNLQGIAIGGVRITIAAERDGNSYRITGILTLAAVYSVSYSPDGTRIASGGSGDNTIRLWNAETGELIRTLEGHTDTVYSVAYSPDGQTLASGSWDKTIRIWDANTGAHLRTLRGHRGSVYSVAYSPDGQTLASGSLADTIRIWDAETGELIRTLEGHTYGVISVAYSPDGQTLASGNIFNRTIHIWNTNTGERLRTLQGYRGSVYSVAYSPDGQTIASGSDTNEIHIWDISDLVAPVDRPTVTVYGPNETQIGAFDVTIVFSSAVTGFEASDIVVTNGTTTNLAGSSARYTATIEPSSVGAVTVSVPANAAANALGNNDASNTYAVDYRSQHVLKGHTSSVLSVAYSPDGQTLASGSLDNTIRIWDANTGAHIRTLQGHTHNVYSVAYSPDGQTLASGSADSTIRIWDANTGAHLRTLRGHTFSVESLAYSPDGQTLASGSSDRTIRIWDANTRAHLRTLKGHTSGVESLAYSPDGQTLASGSWDDTIRIWDANTGAHLRTLKGHTSGVYSVAYSPDGQTLASGSYDDTIRIWNANTGVHLRTLEGHTGRVMSVAYSPDGQTLASGSSDDTIRIWDANTGAHLRTLRRHRGSVYSVAYSPDGQTLASGSWDETVRIWDISDLAAPVDRPTATVSGPSETQTGAFDVTIEFSSAVTGFESSDIIVTNGSVTNLAGSGAAYTATIQPSSAGAVTVSIPANAAGNNLASAGYPVHYTPPQVLTGHKGAVLAAAYSSDGTRIATASADDTALIWNVNAETPLLELTEHTVDVRSAAFSPDGTMLATGSADDTIRIWNAETGAHVRTLEGHEGDVFAVDYSPDGSAIVSASGDRNVRLWNANTGALIKTMTEHAGVVRAAAFSPDGTLIASGGADRTVRLWNAKTGKPLASMKEHGRTIYSVAFSPDGTVLASGSADKTIRFWDVSTQSLIHTRTVGGSAGLVFSVAFSPDGSTLASGNQDGTVHLWASGNGRHKETLEGHTGTVYAVAYSPDSQTLISGSRDKTLRFWSLPTPNLDLNGDGVVDAADLQMVANSYGGSDPNADVNGDGVVDVNDVLLIADALANAQGVAAAPALASLREAPSIPQVSSWLNDANRLIVRSDSAKRGIAVLESMLRSPREVVSTSALLPNYPNPFNPETWIPFELAETSRVKLTIYNSSGQTVRVLELGQLPAGAYRSRAKAAHWDGRNNLGEPVASGIYYVRIEAGSFTALRRMVVLK